MREGEFSVPKHCGCHMREAARGDGSGGYAADGSDSSDGSGSSDSGCGGGCGGCGG